MTPEETIQTVLTDWKVWADRNIARYGRGYRVNGTGHEAGFRELQKLTEPRIGFDRKLQLLDALLMAVPREWGAVHVALISGSILRYMAELD